LKKWLSSGLGQEKFIMRLKLFCQKLMNTQEKWELQRIMEPAFKGAPIGETQGNVNKKAENLLQYILTP
jgi:hypothetical protein